MMTFSLVAMTGLEKCCRTSTCLQWLCHSGERPVARGPRVQRLGNAVLQQENFSYKYIVYSDEYFTNCNFWVIAIHSDILLHHSNNSIFFLLVNASDCF